MLHDRRRRKQFISLLAGVAMCLVVVGCKTTEGVQQVQKADNNRLKPDVSREDSARPFVQLGEKYLELGKYDLARENLLKALKYDPKSVDAHTVLATVYDRVGDSKAAEDNYRAAAELAPRAGGVNNNYGLYLCKQGKYVDARKHFDIAMADGFYADKATIYTNAGTCELIGKGSLDTAETDFRRALELDGKNTQAMYQLANVLYQKNDFFKARAFIQRYEGLGQPSPDALLLARNIEIKLGNAAAARDYAQRLREQFPDSEQTHSLDAVTPPPQTP